MHGLICIALTKNNKLAYKLTLMLHKHATQSKKHGIHAGPNATYVLMYCSVFYLNVCFFQYIFILFK